MARKAQPIQLPNNELRSLKTLLQRGTTTARTQTRARVLDLLHRGQHPDTIAETLQISIATVYNVKGRYQRAGFEAALYDQPRTGRPIEITGVQRAKITALACCAAPAGHTRWTLRLLADKAVELELVEHVSHNAVKEILKKTSSSRT
jgi:putative transposase